MLEVAWPSLSDSTMAEVTLCTRGALPSQASVGSKPLLTTPHLPIVYPHSSPLSLLHTPGHTCTPPLTLALSSVTHLPPLVTIPHPLSHLQLADNIGTLPPSPLPTAAPAAVQAGVQVRMGVLGTLKILKHEVFRALLGVTFS